MRVRKQAGDDVNGQKIIYVTGGPGITRAFDSHLNFYTATYVSKE